MIKTICALSLALITFSCVEQKEGKLEIDAFETFNEGVSLSLDAVLMAQQQDFKKAEELNLKAIEKFHQTLVIDSTHKVAPSALGHSYYLVKEYQKGIEWYRKAIAIDSSNSMNHLEYGLCLINKGQMARGRKSIEHALEIDKSKETLDHAIYGLLDIGVLAFDYGDEYIRQGEKEKGVGYKKFAVGVLFVANTLDSTNQDVLFKGAELTEKMGDSLASNYFEAKLANIDL